VIKFTKKNRRSVPLKTVYLIFNFSNSVEFINIFNLSSDYSPFLRFSLDSFIFVHYVSMT